ncbi:uncharacterized protein LOC107816418 [Nicotiana tabacum]|uniref:Uncharacterized protein LOC107816418 n=1 Tax=Nicotiana tabacum TaxID=4097 RepID=A0AC58SSA9_TOBAC
MSAIVCRKRSYFEELQSASPTSASPPVSKKLRCSSFTTSPVHFSPPSPLPSLFNQLRALFPDMDNQLLEKALEESGNDLDAAIRSLHELRLGYADGKSDTKAYGEMENGMNPTNVPAAQSEDPSENKFPANGVEWEELFVKEMMSATSIDDAKARATRLLENLEKCISSRAGAEAAQNSRKIFHEKLAGMNPTNVPAAQSEDPSENKFPANGVEWEELFVKEMMSATSIDDAKARATRLLENLEKCISSRAGAEAAQNSHKENIMLKQQIEVLLRENTILKRAVSIQHERQKEYDERNQEVHQLKQLIAQGKEQLRTLEINNYALKMHLRQAQQSNSIPGFNPDVF